MKQDRFLIGILAGIGVLILLALVLFFTRKEDKREYMTADSPEAVVYNYVLAITNDDYKKAYSYLAEKEHKPSYEQFRQSFFNGSIYSDNVGVDVGTAEIDGMTPLLIWIWCTLPVTHFPAATPIQTAPNLSTRTVNGN
ncbi:MAG: hypothetical protein IPO36_19085 [Anaerolineales bacterium]|nr:hypothetical protein [Anaerolineales bacterium]